MKTMDDYIPSDAEVVEGASRKRPAAILAAHFISVVLWVAFAMYDIHRNAAGNRAVPARVGAASGKLGVTHTASSAEKPSREKSEDATTRSCCGLNHPRKAKGGRRGRTLRSGGSANATR